jgi:hypothetical protein
MLKFENSGLVRAGHQDIGAVAFPCRRIEKANLAFTDIEL